MSCDLLGVGLGASEKEVRAAYLQLAKVHPTTTQAPYAYA